MKITEIIAGLNSLVALDNVAIEKPPCTRERRMVFNRFEQTGALTIATVAEGNDTSMICFSDLAVNETRLGPADQIINPRVFPNRYKRDFAQKLLLQKLKRNAAIIRPTRDDLRAAQSDFEAEQKRVDREYEDALDDRLKWAGIRKRRLARH